MSLHTEALERFSLTDLGNARRFAAEHGRDLRFTRGLGWFVRDGRHWRCDRDGEVVRLAKRTVRALSARAAELGDAQLAKWALTSESLAHLEAMVSLAAKLPAVAVDSVALSRIVWHPVRVELGRTYARVDLDVWPRRLTEAGFECLRAILSASVRRKCSYGTSGCHIDRVPKGEAVILAERLHELVLDPELIEEPTT